MKVAAAILTYNHISTGRESLFEETFASIQQIGDDRNIEFQLYIVDNGSTDGTEFKVRELGGFCSQASNTTSGHGTNLCARVLGSSGADLNVLSDDDMAWRDGWCADLIDWYAELPPDVVLTGCHLEPEFPWNEVRGTIDSGGRTGLVRASTGAASWSFRNGDWPKIGPVPQQVQGWGDVPACERVWSRGLRIAQIDLAEHAGQFASTWGNPPNANVSLDREKWGL